MVFVLGIERSATTWLSNILDMHPASELYMEPLSQNISRFKEWPDRFTNIEDKSAKANYFYNEFLHLKNRKRFLFSKISDADWAWKTDMETAQKLWKISPFARDFFELNFHRRQTTGYPPKSDNPLQIIKEVRLNFNAPVIKQIDQKVRVVVILRNYAATVQSIQKQIKKGNLKELSQLLKDKYGDTDTESVFEYWAQSYNTLLHDLDSEKINYLLVEHEDLITAGSNTVDKILDFLGLDSASSVYKYLQASNKSGSGKHSTNRSHAEVLEQNRQAERTIYPQLAERIARTKFHPTLQNSITKL